MSKVADALRVQAAALVALADALELELATPAGTADPPADVLDSRAAGKLLGLHPKVVERRARAGEIPAHQLPGGRKWRFMRADVMAWREQHTKKREVA